MIKGLFWGTIKLPSIINWAAGAGSTSKNIVQLQWTVTFYPEIGSRFDGHCEVLLHYLTNVYLIQIFGSTTGVGGGVGSTGVTGVTGGLTGGGGTTTGGFGQLNRQKIGLISIS